MGKKLSTGSQTMEPSVIVNVKGEEGQTFVGILKAAKTAPSPYLDVQGNPKPFNIYEFELLETDMELTTKKNGAYVLAKAKSGDSVSIFAPTRLHNALVQAVVGDQITIKYTGLGKATKFGGKPHTFEVEAE